MMYDFAVVGGGIVGLSTTMMLGRRYPNAKVLLLEKEDDWASHQTGNNSGVIHSGVYYKPGSFKAKFCRQGNRSLVEFCKENGINYEICGKVIVATEPEELPFLDTLYKRGLKNGVGVSKLSSDEVRKIEPHVNCLAGIQVSSAGIVDYRQVCRKYVEKVIAQGVALHLNTKVGKIFEDHDTQIIETNQGNFTARFVINCAGLHSDRIAQANQVDPQAKIVPFRGEYYELIPEKRYLVKGLVYPVPNPNFPFLGVHFTRMIDDSVHAGPNAVLCLKREGYKKTDFDLRDFLDVLTYPGFWKLSLKHGDVGAQEMARSMLKSLFVLSLQRLIPEVEARDLVPAHPGVRAQALKRDGKLVDDFLIIKGTNTMHICNAPSPAATSSLEIGKAIVDNIPESKSLTPILSALPE